VNLTVKGEAQIISPTSTHAFHSDLNNVALFPPPKAFTKIQNLLRVTEMEPLNSPRYTSWDGLEEDELSDIKSAIRDITNVKSDIRQKEALKRSSHKEEKKLQYEISKLLTITRAWARRPRPTSNQQHCLDDQDRAKYRKLYALIQEGLQNSIRATSEDFITQLRGLCHVREEIGATDHCELEEADFGGGENNALMGIEAVIMTDEEKILEAGVFYRERSSIASELTSHTANRIVISPAPSFSDIKALEEVKPTSEEMLEFPIDQETKDGLEWKSDDEDDDVEEKEDEEMDEEEGEDDKMDYLESSGW
jgi:hypothetical protein